jgi:DNA-binding transcriptional LysR family regulator
MRIFVTVVAHGGLAEAGRRLGLTRSAVSKAVIELERSLGARLLDRTTRSVQPTETGWAYYERCVEILAKIEETEAQDFRLSPALRGCLRLSAPVSFGATYLAPAIADFMGRHPDLNVEMIVSDRAIDPCEEGLDLVIQIAALPDASKTQRKLASARRLLVASPQYLAERGVPKAPGDLARHRCLGFGYGPAGLRWRFRRDGKEFVTPITPCMISNLGEVLCAAALAGQGIAKLPSFIAGPYIASGRLISVMPDYSPAHLGIFAVASPSRHLSAKTRLFLDHLAECFKNAPEWERF